LKNVHFVTMPIISPSAIVVGHEVLTRHTSKDPMSFIHSLNSVELQEHFEDLLDYVLTLEGPAYINILPENLDNNNSYVRLKEVCKYKTVLLELSELKPFFYLRDKLEFLGIPYLLDDVDNGLDLDTLFYLSPMGLKLSVEYTSRYLRHPLSDTLLAACISSGLRVVAEGIETEGQFLSCIDRGMYSQGFYFGFPGEPLLVGSKVPVRPVFSANLVSHV